jgi:bacillithiol system protein YtxJ
MGLFSSASNKKELNWKVLSTPDQLNEIEKASFTKIQIIFKHSTSCSISRMAKNRMENGLEELERDADVYYLDLLAHRSVSNMISEKWNVEHESPQILIIKNGKSIYDTSHNMISINDIQQHLI